MTDITDEQRAAIKWLRLMAGATGLNAGSHAEAIIQMLPSELTNPQPVLPTEPGRYVDRTGNDDWLLNGGRWFHEGNSVELAQVQPFAPLRRLVPERPQITRQHVIAVFDAYGDNCDLETINDLVDLANGTYRD